MKKIVMIIMAVALLALPTMAQVYGQQQSQPYGATAPNAQIQSTSTFTGSGSSYSSNPTLNSDGTAAYHGASYSPAKAPGGPRRSKDDPGEVEQFVDPGSPVGDAVLPLLLMAFAFGGVIYLRRRQRVE